MIPFWQVCNNGLSCVRQGIFLGVEFLILIFSIVSLVLLIRKAKGFKFETIPIFCNVLSMLTIILITAFAEDYEYYLAGYFIELYTYFLFFFMFISLASRNKHNFNPHRAKLALYALLILVTLCIITLVVLVFAKVLSLGCQNIYGYAFYACSGTQLIIYFATIWQGSQILKSMKEAQAQHSSSDSSVTSQLRPNKVEDEYILVRKKQIKTILIIFTLTVIVRSIWVILLLVFPDGYQCENYKNTKFLSAKNAFGQVIISLSEAVALVPNILLPYALFIIPYKVFEKNSSIKIQSIRQPSSNLLERTGSIQ